jgi:addiction module HigA family antidote
MARPAIHPGEILADELEGLGMNASELSRALDVTVNRITQILNGKRSITADTALRLGIYFGTGPELWMNLQQNYELRLAQQEAGPKIESTVHPRERSLAS